MLYNGTISGSALRVRGFPCMTRLWPTSLGLYAHVASPRRRYPPLRWARYRASASGTVWPDELSASL